MLFFHRTLVPRLELGNEGNENISYPLQYGFFPLEVLKALEVLEVLKALEVLEVL